jgi:hypothetical protein
MGGVGSGGPNGGPQYSPANVSATGGDGQSGNINYTGMPYSQNQEVNNQRKAAPIDTKQATPDTASLSGMFAGIGALHDTPANPDEFISHGSDTGRGGDSSVLPKQITADSRLLENQAIAKQYLPLFLHAAQSPDTPDSFKQFIGFLADTLQ